MRLPAWDPAQEGSLLALLGIATAGYVAYHYLSRAAVARWGAGTPRAVFAGRIVGALSLGLPALPWAAAQAPGLLALWGAPRVTSWAWVIGALALAAPALWLAAGGATHRARYPQVRVEAWTPRLVAAELASWGLYLIGYEWCFRGLLVCGLAGVLGLWPALVVGTSIYVLVHLDKDLGECLACAPVGVGLGLLTWTSGSVWPAILLHLGLAAAGNLFPLLRGGELPRPAATR